MKMGSYETLIEFNQRITQRKHSTFSRYIFDPSFYRYYYFWLA